MLDQLVLDFYIEFWVIHSKEKCEKVPKVIVENVRHALKLFWQIKLYFFLCVIYLHTRVITWVWLKPKVDNHSEFVYVQVISFNSSAFCKLSKVTFIDRDFEI